MTTTNNNTNTMKTTLTEALIKASDRLEKRHLVWAARTGRLPALMRAIATPLGRTGLKQAALIEAITEIASRGGGVTVSVDTDTSHPGDPEIVVTGTAVISLNGEPILRGHAYGLCCYHIPGGRNLPVWGVNDWDHEGEWHAIAQIADRLSLGDLHEAIEIPEEPFPEEP